MDCRNFYFFLFQEKNDLEQYRKLFLFIHKSIAGFLFERTAIGSSSWKGEPFSADALFVLWKRQKEFLYKLDGQP